LDAGKTESIRPVEAGQTAKIPATPVKPDAPKVAAAGTAGAAATTKVTPKAEPEAEKLDLAEAPVRKSRAPLFILLAAAIAVLAFVVFRPGQDQAGSKRKGGATAAASFSPPPVKVGEEVEKANLRTAVLDVTSDAKPVDANQKPDLGQKFAAVDFKLTNNDSRAVMFTAANALRLVDSAGGVHEPSAIGAPDPRFPDGIVAPAQVVQGWIAFQIPSNLSVKQLKFDARKVPKIS